MGDRHDLLEHHDGEGRPQNEGHGEEGKKKREISAKTVKLFNNKIREQISDKKLKAFFNVINDIGKVLEEMNKENLPENKKKNFTLTKSKHFSIQ